MDPTAPPHVASHVTPEFGPGPNARLPAWADTLTRWLDDVIRIPGTNIRIGADAILGFFVPGLGDAASGVASLGLLMLAMQRGLPRIVLARMILNLAVDALIGAIPLVGDLFDVTWKANRKNLDLIKRHEVNPHARASTVDYLLVGAGIVIILLAIALPIAVAVWLTGSLIGELAPG
jgi:hypothetical protein